ncbi:MAG: flagellar assembly protein FliX [Phenylobacterium sp.]
MKVSGTGGLTPSAGPRAARGGDDSGFRLGGTAGAGSATPAASVSGPAGVVGVQALIALQDVETATERRRRSVGRAGRLLDELDRIKIALLGDDLSGAQLDALSRAVREQRAATDDPKLEGVLDEIETRAAVELAKLEMARVAR